MALNVRGQVAHDVSVISQVTGNAAFIALTETWLGEDSLTPVMEGFVAFNFVRPQCFQVGPARGGICCYIRGDVAPHVSTHASDASKSFVVLKVDKAAGFAKDLYLVVTYIVPRGSTRISLATRSIWQELEECVTELSILGLVLVVGDQNARTGQLRDFTTVDESEDDLLGPAPTCSVRRNQDQVTNWNGRQLVAMCKRTGLRLANGRVQGDTEGAFTFVSLERGMSAIDNTLACPATLAMMHSLRVLPAPFTDHYAIEVTLPLGGAEDRAGPSQVAEESRERRMAGAANIKRWVDEILPGFADELAAIAELAQGNAIQGREEVHAMCDRFDRVVGSFAQVQTEVVRQPRWFDHDLARGRQAAHAAMRRAPGSAIARQLQKEYQRKLRKRQRGMKRSQVIALVTQARENPAAFWKKFKPRKPLAAKITKEQWGTHFSTLLGEVPETGSGAPSVASQAGSQQRFADGSELNTLFTTAEVEQGIQCLRKGSATLGYLSVQAIQAAAPMLAPCVTALFNAFSSAGCLPPSWALSAITPIHKAGDTGLPGNYRGIAVGTVLAKLFASLINSRLSHWAESNGLRAQGQAGFREDQRCADHLLVLRTLIEQQRASQRPLYTCFVDFRKAYDSVPRDLLWQKLETLGVQGWFLDSIKALYGSVPMAVNTPEGLTASFEAVMGVKQGCPLSPTLFGLYLDDFEQALEANHIGLDLPVLPVQRVPALLYADDLALVSTSKEGLQAQLVLLHAYAAKWRLTVNIDKTKAVVFRAAASSSQVYPLPLVFDGARIEVVDSFRYLGIELHCTKPFASAAEPRTESAERAQLAMYSRCKQLGIQDPALKLQLWDALVKPTLLYGVEFWGAGDVGKGVLAADLVHRAFLRRLLGVRTGTPNMAVLAEVGRYPLVVFAAKMLCNSWNRLVEMDNGRLVKQAFLLSAALGPLTRSSSTHKSWAGQVASFFTALGLPCDLRAPQTVNVSAVLKQLQSSYLDSVKDSSSSKVQQYLLMRQEVDTKSYTPAAYLQAVGGWKQRKRLAQLRTGSHWLAVESQRFGPTTVNRQHRICQRCGSNSVDDEEHMLFDCTALEEERLEHPSLFERNDLSLADFMAQDPTEMAAFVYDCFNACDI
jgi:hypothetical protein